MYSIFKAKNRKQGNARQRYNQEAETLMLISLLSITMCGFPLYHKIHVKAIPVKYPWQGTFGRYKLEL
jgi:hypothetical protein